MRGGGPAIHLFISIVYLVYMTGRTTRKLTPIVCNVEDSHNPIVQLVHGSVKYSDKGDQVFDIDTTTDDVMRRVDSFFDITYRVALTDAAHNEIKKHVNDELLKRINGVPLPDGDKNQKVKVSVWVSAWGYIVCVTVEWKSRS